MSYQLAQLYKKLLSAEATDLETLVLYYYHTDLETLVLYYYPKSMAEAQLSAASIRVPCHINCWQSKYKMPGKIQSNQH